MRHPLSVLAALVVGTRRRAGPGRRPKGYMPPASSFTDYSEKYAKGFECARVVVPLDRSDVKGRKISLAITRVKHTAEPNQGVMLVNPGGPGGSGTGFAVLKVCVPNGGG